MAPGPANGFTLDLIDCLERFSELIDWAMIILNPLEPWPGELVLGAAAANGVSLITRVVDYGGAVPRRRAARPRVRASTTTASSVPDGWVRAGHEKLELMRPYAERHGLTMLQLACAWNLAHPAVRCVAPTLIQESGRRARPIEDKRAELRRRQRRAAPQRPRWCERSAAIGENTGCMALKGASLEYDGPAAADRWELDEELLAAVAGRWEHRSGARPRRAGARIGQFKRSRRRR